MPQLYYMVLTAVGAAKKANTEALGQSLQLTQLAVGDGGGVYVAPDATWVALTNEVDRVAINQIYQDPDNVTYLVVEAVIPQDIPVGYYIREVGVFDIDGDMIMVGAYPQTYKPTLGEGAARDLYIRVITEIGSAASVTLKIDPAIVLSTRKYVDDSVAVIPGWVQNHYSEKHTAFAATGLLRYLPFSLQDRLAASDGASSDYFGMAVALSADGHTAMVGAPYHEVGANFNQGCGYVFSRDSAGVWTQQAQLTVGDGATNDNLGYSVALSADGNTAMVGARTDDVGLNTDQGSCFVFTRERSGIWTQQAQLIASDGAASDYFGQSVALSADGDTAIVGAHLDDVGVNTNQGSCYVFTRDGAGVWTQQAQLTAVDGAASNNFGMSVALSASGHTAIVGANTVDVGANVDQGSSYVFIRDSAGVWTQQAQLIALDGLASDIFGQSVALSADGNTAIVGAYQDDVGANLDQGSSYVFVRDGAGAWAQQAQLIASDGAADDWFGYCVDVSADGNTAIVGCAYSDVGANGNQGSVYVFIRDGAASWVQHAKLTAIDGAPGDYLGLSVGLSADGNTALAGAYLDDVGATLDQGSCYVFTKIR